MLNSLIGNLSGKSGGKAFLENSGIEWELDVSYTTTSSLPPIGSRVRLFTYLHHREDIMKLFGFATEEERMLFFDLIKVDGIGPKQALRILSGTTVDSLLGILETGDVDALKRIPGLGVKTAQKILLALKGKLSIQEAEEPQEGQDLVSALTDMGFDRKKAALAVKDALVVLKGNGLAGEELERETFRQAIVRLSS